jgi:hypothetical protein
MQNLITPTIIQPRSRREPLPLKAPDIEVAFHDDDNLGLIPVSELNAPLIVNLEVWDAAEPGYTYQLAWDGERYGPEKVIQEGEKPGDRLTLEIPVDLLTEGVHRLAYRTYSEVADFENYSDDFPVIIDRTAPGMPLLAAIQFPVEVQNGLTAAELARLGDTLEVQVAGYTGMAKHDVIHTYWGDTAGPTAVVDETDMGLNKVVFDFSRDFLISIASGAHDVSYRVVDRAGNISEVSLAVSVVLLLDEIPEDYPAPLLDPVIGTLIDYTEAKPGVQVDIPRYPGAAAFDQITLYWGKDHPLFPVQIPLGNETADIVLSLKVPYEALAFVPVGEVSITYTVTRQNQLNGMSLPTVVDVYLTLPIPEPALAPTIQGTSVSSPNQDDNFIDEDDYELNSRAIVVWSDSFRVNDDIHLFWGDQQRPQWYQINEEDLVAANDLVIPIANSIMRAQGTGAEIPVYYSVIRQGNPNASRSPLQRVTVRSKENLPGGPEGIEGPSFKLNPAGYISQSVAPDGADGQIQPYDNIAENQKLFFTFKGFDRDNNPIDAATYTASRELDDQDIVNGYSFRVPYNILRTICRGFCEAYIRVEPAPGSNQSSVTSKLTRVPVEMRESSEAVCTIN